MSRSAADLLTDETFVAMARRALAGRCALFLGAGASLPSGRANDDVLADLIASEVLMAKGGYPLVTWWSTQTARLAGLKSTKLSDCVWRTSNCPPSFGRYARYRGEASSASISMTSWKRPTRFGARGLQTFVASASGLESTWTPLYTAL